MAGQLKPVTQSLTGLSEIFIVGSGSLAINMRFRSLGEGSRASVITKQTLVSYIPQFQITFPVFSVFPVAWRGSGVLHTDLRATEGGNTPFPTPFLGLL